MVYEEGVVPLNPPLRVESIPVGSPLTVRSTFLAYAVPGCDVAKSAPTESGALEELRSLAVLLAKDYRWDEAQAAVYVLTGITPLVSRITARASRNLRFSGLSRLVLTVDPSCTPDQVATATRRPEASFSVPAAGYLQRSIYAWRNKELARHFSHGRYSGGRNFTREAGAAQRRVLEPSMQVPLVMSTSNRFFSD